jgi:hypothetical protein
MRQLAHGRPHHSNLALIDELASLVVRQAEQAEGGVAARKLKRQRNRVEHAGRQGPTAEQRRSAAVLGVDTGRLLGSVKEATTEKQIARLPSRKPNAEFGAVPEQRAVLYRCGSRKSDRAEV